MFGKNKAALKKPKKKKGGQKNTIVADCILALILCHNVTPVISNTYSKSVSAMKLREKGDSSSMGSQYDSTASEHR